MIVLQNPSDVLTCAANGALEIWLAEGLLIRALDGLDADYLWKFARPAYKNAVPAPRRAQSKLPLIPNKSWRWWKRPEGFYYDLATIPNRAPRHYRAQIPANIVELHREWLKRQSVGALEVALRSALSMGYKEYLYPYNTYKTEQQTALAQSAAVLEALLNYLRENEVNPSSQAFWSDAGRVVDGLNLRYLPSNRRRLQQKALAVLGGNTVAEVVTLPREGLKNAQKELDPQVTAWLLTLRAQGENWTNARIQRKVQDMCERTGLRCPSTSWMEAFLATETNKYLTQMRWAGGRKALPYAGYTPIANALFAGDCWQMDATRANLIEVLVNGAKCFVSFCVVRDVYSGDVLGWSFGFSESRWMYEEALRMAVNNAGYLPYELVLDQFPGHNTKEWETITGRLENEGTKVTYTSIATGKAKTERWFGTFQTIFMAETPWFYGEGIFSTRPYAHRTAVYLKAVRKNALKKGWNYDELERTMCRLIEGYRHTKYSAWSRQHRALDKTPFELQRDSEKPHVKTLSPMEFLAYFGLEKTVTLSRDGLIRTEIAKVEYFYQVSASDFRVIAENKSVVMCYDVDDLGSVYLFSVAEKERERKFLCIASQLERAQVYGPDADFKTLGANKKRLADLETKRKEQFAELTKASQGGNEALLLMPMYGAKKDLEAAETAFLLAATEEDAAKKAPVTKDAGRKRKVATTAMDSLLAQL